MTIHASARVMQRYNLKTPDRISPTNVPLGKKIFERDAYDAFHQWSMDLFRYDSADCVAIVHCATRLTLFLYNVQKSHMDRLGHIISQHLLDLYMGDAEMHACLLRFFQDEKYLVFSASKKRSIAALAEHMIVEYSQCGRRFREYTDFRNVLHMRQYIYDANFNYRLTRVENGVEITYAPGAYFRQKIIERYSCGAADED